jgi:catechol 2,3-dioxygenase-like lactoylglutathione lyase family enzyme
MSSSTANVRYMVNNVDAAVAWYTKHLGFSLLSNAAPAFADVTLGSLRLLLSAPQARPDERCRTVHAQDRAAGIAFTSSSIIFPQRWRGCVPPACSSEMTS